MYKQKIKEFIINRLNDTEPICLHGHEMSVNGDMITIWRTIVTDSGNLNTIVGAFNSKHFYVTSNVGLNKEWKE